MHAPTRQPELPASCRPAAPGCPLSVAELWALDRVSRGEPVGRGTVSNQLDAARKRLGAASTVEALRIAFEHGWITEEPGPRPAYPNPARKPRAPSPPRPPEPLPPPAAAYSALLGRLMERDCPNRRALLAAWRAEAHELPRAARAGQRPQLTLAGLISDAIHERTTGLQDRA